MSSNLQITKSMFAEKLWVLFYPVVGTDASKVGSRTGAEVERRHREAASLQTHHVGTAGGAVLHIAQVWAILQESMATSEWSIQTCQTRRG